VIRGAIVFLLGVALGAAVAVGTTVLIAPQPAATPSAPQGDSLDRFGKAFEDAVARALRRIQSEATTRAAQVAPGEAESAPQRRRSSDPPPPAPDAGTSLTRDPATPLHEKDTGRLGQLVVRTQDAKARRRTDWMFLSESSVSDALGLPDQIGVNENGTESWYYDVQFTNRSGEPENGRLDLTFHRGRVVEIRGADDIPE
jgi:hypothetical protein